MFIPCGCMLWYVGVGMFGKMAIGLDDDVFSLVEIYDLDGM